MNWVKVFNRCINWVKNSNETKPYIISSNPHRWASFLKEKQAEIFSELEEEQTHITDEIMKEKMVDKIRVEIEGAIIRLYGGKYE
ncbi:hypothetical protein ACFL35_05020, partial [Candidatus Riflebacteria bacterium]